VSKRAAQKIDTERFNVKKLDEMDVKEKYQVTIRNKFAALENLEDSEDINGAWDNIRDNNRFLRRVFGPKRDEVTAERRKLHSGELHNLYSSPDDIRQI
jgi:hypothetical protein